MSDRLAHSVGCLLIDRDAARDQITILQKELEKMTAELLQQKDKSARLELDVQFQKERAEKYEEKYKTLHMGRHGTTVVLPLAEDNAPGQ